DYLAFAIAIYDDEPTWYKYIAGRIYEEYVPVRNEYYKAGYYPQGISTYLPIRFGSDLWSAWLLQAATGNFPYNQANMKQVMHSAYAHIQKGVADNTKTVIFSEGDHQGRSGKEAMKQMALPSMISAYLFNDSTAMSWADFAEYAYFPATYYLILKSKGTTGTASTRYEGLDLITYNGGWLGQMIAHSNWESNCASVYMKIGNRMTANHDHADSGSFQIYYKSILAGDSGYYDKYESDHHKNYHQATIAHNSIVLKDGNTIVGQKQPSETTSFSTWQSSSDYKMGTTTGYAYGYTDTAKTNPKYAYIAGDIADAYCTPKTLFGYVYGFNSSELDRCDRRMLAVYDTGNSDVPMYFFVYDYITAKDTKYQKVFLLHTVTEPSISGKTATVVNGSGKLVLQNVVGDCTLSKVGGEKPNNWKVGNTTYSLISSKSDKTDGYWGRLEVATPSGSKTNVMLNVMYVCDASKSPSGQTASKISTSTVTGSVIGNVAAIFVDSADRATSTVSFASGGSGTLNYYVSGVKAGKWTVKVGSSTQTVTATSDGGLLVFTAPAGTVTLTPQ
ncbi:MAG: heparinase II/III family protein, partial [Clostridia bacterium]|nr:heparinase II/III family protein [Clostridia bacterium]